MTQSQSTTDAGHTERPLFSFAVVNWNTRDLLDQCLASIYAEAGDLPIEVLVTDNNSEDGSAHMVTARYPEVILVRHADNVGFAKGHAPLFERSRGRYHVLVNSDVRLLPGCLAKVADTMAANPKIGVLGCRIQGPDDHIQPSCRRFPNLWHQLVDASGINRLFPHSAFWNAYKMGGFDHQSSLPVDQVMGSFFLIRRELIQQIGGLDTAFFMYYEEVDYCLRCRKAGYSIYFEADAVVWHEGGGSAKKVRVATIRRTMRSMRHYYTKHFGAWTWLPLLFIVALDLFSHTVYAGLKGAQPLQTLRAYALGWWDLFTFRSADT